MEALHNNTKRERLVELVLHNRDCKYGFERDLNDPMRADELRERELLVEGYVSDFRLKRFAQFMYRHDTDLAPYTWGVLLKDNLFFETVQPGGDLRGRDYDLEVLHIPSGQLRDKWLINGGNPIELLVPSLWAIGVMSLKNQYGKLYVHDNQPDGSNVCRDGFGHQNRSLEPAHAAKLLSRIDASIGLEAWNRQAQIQGLNSCIYSFVERWAITSLPSL